MSALPPLTIVPAGAGSGKTYTIQEQLGDWIERGLVAPERVMAVTYTEAAAAELRERISGGLLARGQVEGALRLSQAYISTIHALGLRLLGEFAFDAGISPRPRLLNEDEENALVRNALARTDKADRVVGDLEAFGYSYNAGTGRDGAGQFRDTVLETVRLLRSIGSSGASAGRGQLEAATRAIAQRYGRAEHDNGRTRRLRDRVSDLLDTHPRSLAEQFGASKTATNQFRADFSALSAAARRGTLESDWGLWQKLRKLRVNNRGAPLPSTYVKLARRIIAEADGLVHHIGPLQHARLHVEALLSAGQDVVDHYSEAKRQAGLVDYTDMITAAGRLLLDKPETLEILAGRVDCLVVDEFQDTNPLQFALLWQIKEAGVPTLVVGDLKQAIMGFQGADPRLFAAMERTHRDVSRPLTSNWRSSPGLMDFVNAVGPLLFGDEYVALDARRKPGSMDPLEVVQFDRNPRKERDAARALAVARRLRELLDDPDQTVVDGRTRQARRLRGSDVAVLCPTNRTLARYGEVFRAQGLSVNHQSTGWLMSRAVQIAVHALAYLANPADRHAALYLAATELGSSTLEDGLRQLIEHGRVEDPLLRKLDALAEGVADRTVYALVADTLGALSLFDVVAAWPSGEQDRANLIRLLSEAGEFMRANREALAHGGYHGYGTKTFLSWLATRQDDDEQPEKAVLDEDAISLRTWHASKGLEWPVVAVCNMDRQVRSVLPHIALEYTSFDDLSRLLEKAQIHYWPRYAAPEQNQSQQAELQKGAITVAKRMLYVALTRARDKLLLEWPAFQAKARGSRTISYWKILGPRWRLSSEAERLDVGHQQFRCKVSIASDSVPDSLGPSGQEPGPWLPVTGRRAIRRATAPAGLTPDSIAVSGLAGLEDATEPLDLEFFRYGDGLELETDLAGTELGTYLHRCFELLGSRPGLESSLADLTGIEMKEPSRSRVVTAVAQFEGWLCSCLGSDSVMREWPVLVLDDRGSVLAGIADLVVQTRHGVWILDHKSDRVEDPSATFRKYRPQLEAYARAVRENGHSVLGVGVNLIRLGQVALMRLGPVRM